MTIDDIIFTMGDLKRRLNVALSTMEYSDEVTKIRDEIKAVQAQCPHSNEKYHWNIETGHCPYCGYKKGE